MWPDGVQLAGWIRACTYSLVVLIPCTERPSLTSRQSRQTGVRKTVPARLLRQRLQMGCTLRSKQDSCCVHLGVYCLLLTVVSDRSTTFCDLRIDERQWHRSQLRRGVFPAPWGPSARINGVLMLCKQRWLPTAMRHQESGWARSRWEATAMATSCSRIPLGLLWGGK